jgi:hypothetical protein
MIAVFGPNYREFFEVSNRFFSKIPAFPPLLVVQMVTIPPQMGTLSPLEAKGVQDG